ncbi:hypothetical protein M9H77_09466 [Catharanthus roseus]|uniref:Uncharacterized protein n=1 Tax=Catharanthus roseus TaxID=4058 RepID=A0ACC0C0V4_CATRO|nr:hypothetical protein M9H77_09466 [Catharanthus roseus]
MEPSKSEIKGFFKQKKTSGISKAKSSSMAKKKLSSPKQSASYGSDITQPAALVSHGSVDLKDDYDENEKRLRQFDMNMVYGPCIGISRLDRWERARAMGLNPPEEIENLLKYDQVKNESLWDGRV